MSCPQCQGVDRLFNENTARADLRSYIRKGPSKSTRMLVDTIRDQGVDGLSLMDIGGGVGAIQHELKRAGVERVTAVDASSAYLEIAQKEAARQGYADAASYHFGDFVDLAPQLEPADIVTLDKVICCYHQMEQLVQSSVALTRKFYGVIFPVDAWWAKFASKVFNLFLSLTSNPYRAFIHPTREIEAIVRQHGFRPVFYRRYIYWQVFLFARA